MPQLGCCKACWLRVIAWPPPSLSGPPTKQQLSHNSTWRRRRTMIDVGNDGHVADVVAGGGLAGSGSRRRCRGTCSQQG